MAKRKHDATRAAFRNVGAIYPIGGLGGSGLETVVEGCTGPMKALFDLHDPHPAEVRTGTHNDQKALRSGDNWPSIARFTHACPNRDNGDRAWSPKSRSFVRFSPVKAAVINEEMEALIGQVKCQRRSLAMPLPLRDSNDQVTIADVEMEDQIGAEVFHHIHVGFD